MRNFNSISTRPDDDSDTSNEAGVVHKYRQFGWHRDTHGSRLAHPVQQFHCRANCWHIPNEGEIDPCDWIRGRPRDALQLRISRREKNKRPRDVQEDYHRYLAFSMLPVVLDRGIEQRRQELP
jgi:hypothetical protein